MLNSQFPPGSRPAAQASTPESTPKSSHNSHAEGMDPLVAEISMAWGLTPPIQQVSAQTNLFMQGLSTDEAYLVLNGKVQLRRENPVSPTLVDQVGRGEWLGVGELLHGVSFTATATAATPVSVVVVNREMLEKLLRRSSPLVVRALRGATLQNQRFLVALESYSLDQTFLGLCRGLELLFRDEREIPEGRLLHQLNELFALPILSLEEAIRLLEGLNLVYCRKEPGKEAMWGLRDPSTFHERVRSFSEKWRARLPALLGERPPPEPLELSEVCEAIGVEPVQMLRRMTLADFPTEILRFDPKGFQALRDLKGDGFFKKRVGGRELLAKLESVDELIDAEASLLREVLPRLELSQLIRLLAGVDEALKAHLLSGLSSRMRRTVEEELEHMPPTGSTELADIEKQLIAICRNA